MEQIQLKEIALDTLCCDMPMIELGLIDFMDMNTNSIYRYVCKKCFRIIDVVDYGLDDEELENLKGHSEELDKAIDENENQAS